MKKSYKKFTLFAVFMLGASGLLPGTAANAQTESKAKASQANTRYVSLDGKDDASGTKEDPFASIQEAADSLDGKTSKDNPGQILIRKGTYKMTETVKLDSSDSYITFSAYGDEKVTLSGANTLDNSRFQKLDGAAGEQYSSQSRIQAGVKDKIYTYDLKAENIPVGSIRKNGFNWPQQPLQPELVVDGKTQTLAQYPNGDNPETDYIRRDSMLAGIEKNEGRIPEAGSAERANYDAAQKAGASAEHADGDVPRNAYFDKTDSPKSYEEMLKMKAPIFYAATDDFAGRMLAWAPASTADETQENQPDRTDIDNTKVEDDGWLSGYFENNYANDMLKIYSADAGTRLLHTKYPSLQGVQDKNLQVKAVNLLSELDAPGEYYIDRYNDNNVMYYYPENDTVENKTITLTSLQDPLFQLEGTTGVTLQNLTFEGGTGFGTVLLDAESCKIDHCEFSSFSLDAIKIGQNNNTITTDPSYTTSRGGHNNQVTSCSIHDMGGGGVYLSGGVEKTLERGNNLVANCEIFNISRLKTYTPAVYLEGAGNTASENYIHDAPHMVIQIMGNDMLVTKNKIENTCTNASDMAPIYAGRSWTWLGNEVSCNYIKGVKSDGNFGIYLDDNMSGMTIKNNIFEDISSTPIFSNKGYGQDIENNVMITDKAAVQYAANEVEIGSPIANEKVLQIRRDAFLKEGDGTSFTNTAANIQAWLAHYQERYPYLNKRFIPAYDAPDQAANPDSYLVPSYQVLNHQIVVGNGEFIQADESIAAAQDENFNTANYRSASTAELGLDTKTGHFAETSPLASEKDFGAQWIAEWNKNFDLTRNGIQKAAAETPDDNDDDKGNTENSGNTGNTGNSSTGNTEKPQNDRLPMFRAYNPNSGEHLYTLSEKEWKDVIKAGWSEEGTAWHAASSGNPVYRMYNPNSGEHFYTLDKGESDGLASAGWHREGIGFYSDKKKGQAIYRLFNPNETGAGSHHYTISESERDGLIEKGWSGEGTAFYGAAD